MIYTTVDQRSPAPVEIYHTKMLYINWLDGFLSININIVSTCFLFILFFLIQLAQSKLCPPAQRGGFLSVLNLTPTLRGSRFNEGVPEWVFMIDSDWCGFHRFSILHLDLCFSKLKAFWEINFGILLRIVHRWQIHEGFDNHQFFFCQHSNVACVWICLCQALRCLQNSRQHRLQVLLRDDSLMKLLSSQHVYGSSNLGLQISFTPSTTLYVHEDLWISNL